MTLFFVAAVSTILSAAFFGLNIPFLGAIWALIAVINAFCFALAKDERPEI